ncbi:MAG TPA: COX15/CtaA family protein [Terriglobales bacterium]|nr:COX15/CtaA family protein [Terriglobales bacterium]
MALLHYPVLPPTTFMPVKSEVSGTVPARFHRGLHRFAVLLSGCVFLLILAGALVTSEDAGLSVPDWPTSFGSIYKIPPMVGGVKFEHTHRMIAEAVGLLTIVFCLAAFRIDRRKWFHYLSLTAIGTVIAQGILGGLTVLMFLPWYISSAHAALGQTFFSIAVLMALYSGAGWMRSTPDRLADEGSPSTRTLTVLSICTVYLQLFLGAAFRHSGMSILPHLVNSVLVSGILAWTAIRVLSRYGHIVAVRRPAAMLIGLLLLQLGFGFAAYLTRVVWGKNAAQPLPSMVSTTVVHVAIGALLLATCFVLEEQVRRYLQREPLAVAARAPERKAISA